MHRRHKTVELSAPRTDPSAVLRPKQKWRATSLYRIAGSLLLAIIMTIAIATTSMKQGMQNHIWLKKGSAGPADPTSHTHHAPEKHTLRQQHGKRKRETVISDPKDAKDDPMSADASGGLGMFALSTGTQTSLPLMYELGLRSMMKVDPNFTLYATSPLVAKEWHPNVILVDMNQVAEDLSNIHPAPVWKELIQKIKARGENSLAHMADFLRFWRLYMYGGFYTDIDSIWLRPIPYDVSKNVVLTQDGNGKVCIGAFGGPKHDPIWRKSLEQMPSAYGGGWEDIGSSAITQIVKTELAEVNVNDTLWHHHRMEGGLTYSDNIFQPLRLPLPNDRHLISVSDIQMYGLRFTEGPQRYSRPMTNEDKTIYRLLSQKSFSHQLYGSRHARNKDKLPTAGSYFDTLLRDFGIKVN